MTITHLWWNLSPLLHLGEKTEWEFWVSRFTVDQLVGIQLGLKPQLEKVPYHILHELLGRKYNKVKERMEKRTSTDEDDSTKDVQEPLICAICSDECKKTEERAYFNCGHTYHSKCFPPVWKKKSETVPDCLVCGQKLHCYLPVAEGESIFWRDNN